MYDRDLVFRLCRAMRDAGDRSGLGAMDRSSRSILEYIGELETMGESVQVKTVVGSGLFGTAPTVLSRLEELEKAGWIARCIDPDDGRARRAGLCR